MRYRYLLGELMHTAVSCIWDLGTMPGYVISRFPLRTPRAAFHYLAALRQSSAERASARTPNNRNIQPARTKGERTISITPI
jgi:hypothetical protein